MTKQCCWFCLSSVSIPLLLIRLKSSDGWIALSSTYQKNCQSIRPSSSTDWCGTRKDLDFSPITYAASRSKGTKPNFYSHGCFQPIDRRNAVVATATAIGALLYFPTTSSAQAAAAADASSLSWTNLRTSLLECIETLQKLLDNWKNAVVDCRFADVPRELLETKNKELLLEKASEFALFDKSVSVETCQIKIMTVRDYLGTTGIGPLAKLNDLLNAIVRQSLLVDDDTMDIELLIERTERVQRDVGIADSLAYSARRDFGSLNNFEKADMDRILNDETTNLSKARNLIRTIVTELQEILQMIPTR